MVASRMVQARVPGEIQDIANQVIQASGLTVSDVVRVLMTRIAQDKAIPSALFQPNAETLEAFAEIERGGLKRFATVDELFDDLHADD
jgi:DNA-damage-inducible protein J